MHSAADPVTWQLARVAVAGRSGAGKTTLARRISAIGGIPHTELDALFHGPNWQPLPSFRAEVEALVARPRWVTEWQYDSARELIADRADTLVWLDLPLRVSMARLVRRTIRRSARREVLWNGNREPWLGAILTDPDHIIRFSYRNRHKLGRRVPALAGDRPGLRVVRLRSQREVDRWVWALAAATGR